MRFLGRLLAVVLGLIMVLSGVAYLLPREVTVERTIVIAAPPEAVFPHLNSLQKFVAWSPWSDIDPEMVTTFSGPQNGVGNRMEWSSQHDEVGSGTQEIVASVPNERVETALDFGEMGPATAWQELEPVAVGSAVTWGLVADMGNTPMGRYVGLAMDRLVGPDYEEGLVRLKALIEAG